MSKKTNIVYFFRFGVENFDKGIADDLALRFRISHSFQAAQESLTRVDFDNVDIKGIVRSMGHHVHDLIGLFKPQQTVIDKDTRQLIADGSCEQCRHNRRVYPSGKTQYDVLIAHLGTHSADNVLDNLIRRPKPLAATDIF